MQGPPRPDQFWAKLKYEDDDRSTGTIVAWNPLLAHSADVAATTEALLRETILGARLARLIGWARLSDVHIARLSALAAIHDAGKVNHGFQDQAFDREARSPGHVQPMVDVIEAPMWHEPLLGPLGLEAMLAWFEGPRDPTHFLYATWAHHGEPKKAKSHVPAHLWTKNDRRDPPTALRRLGEAVQTWFPAAFEPAEPFPESYPAFQHAYNGLLTLADWIGSGFPYVEDEGADLIARARRLAEERLAGRGLIAAPHRAGLGEEPVGFRGVLDPECTPYDVQRVCLAHPVYRNGGLTVLESDTGSGKTEAALARFFRLYQAGLVDGMYFAVPTRTAAKQLYARIDAIVKAVYAGSDAPPVIQAVPGYYRADAVEGTLAAPFEIQWHDEAEDDTVRERRWAAEHPKRYLAGAIVVGTIDQVLLSTLQVKHAHMRAAALLRHFLVVDEVHASDVYMTRLLMSVLDHHLAAGGHALLMSATLGTAARIRLTTNGRGAVPPPEDAAQIDYPLVTHVDAARAAPTLIPTAPSGYRKRVRMTAAPIAGDHHAIAQRAVEAARQGARVLVVRNLVDDCVATQQAVEEVAGADRRLLFGVDETPAPHHSRFASVDRARLDAAIEDAFGKTTAIRGVVAVATQTVQQSLDISASLLITDLCPVDVLLQRLGRLHRHGRAHPQPHAQPTCLVVTPEQRELGAAVVEGGDEEGRGLKGPHGLGTVYHDLRVLEATWRLLEDDDLATWTIPDDNRRLVERGTHPVLLAQIAEERGGPWRLHQRWVFGERAAREHASKNVELQRDKDFGLQSFRDDLDFVKTRLGQDDIHVDLPERLAGPFDRGGLPSVAALSIPEHTLKGALDALRDDATATDVEVLDGGFAFALADRRFRYDRFGLQKTDAVD